MSRGIGIALIGLGAAWAFAGAGAVHRHLNRDARAAEFRASEGERIRAAAEDQKTAAHKRHEEKLRVHDEAIARLDKTLADRQAAVAAVEERFASSILRFETEKDAAVERGDARAQRRAESGLARVERQQEHALRRPAAKKADAEKRKAAASEKRTAEIERYEGLVSKLDEETEAKLDAVSPAEETDNARWAGPAVAGLLGVLLIVAGGWIRKRPTPTPAPAKAEAAPPKAIAAPKPVEDTKIAPPPPVAEEEKSEETSDEAEPDVSSQPIDRATPANEVELTTLGGTTPLPGFENPEGTIDVQDSDVKSAVSEPASTATLRGGADGVIVSVPLNTRNVKADAIDLVPSNVDPTIADVAPREAVLPAKAPVSEGENDTQLDLQDRIEQSKQKAEVVDLRAHNDDVPGENEDQKADVAAEGEAPDEADDARLLPPEAPQAEVARPEPQAFVALSDEPMTATSAPALDDPKPAEAGEAVDAKRESREQTASQASQPARPARDEASADDEAQRARQVESEAEVEPEAEVEADPEAEAEPEAGAEVEVMADTEDATQLDVGSNDAELAADSAAEGETEEDARDSEPPVRHSSGKQVWLADKPDAPSRLFIEGTGDELNENDDQVGAPLELTLASGTAASGTMSALDPLALEETITAHETPRSALD